MMLYLNDEDVFGADAASSSNCPIARGLKRTLKTEAVSVQSHAFYVNGRAYGTTPTMKKFIRRFDEDRVPLTMEFLIPYELH